MALVFLDWRRHPRIILTAAVVAGWLLVVSVLRPHQSPLNVVSILTYMLTIVIALMLVFAGFLFAGRPYLSQRLEGTQHLLLALPVPAAMMLGARVISVSFPLAAVGLSGWAVMRETAHVPGSAFQNAFLSFVQSLRVIAVSLDAGAFAETVLATGDAAMVGVILLNIVFSVTLGLAYLATMDAALQGGLRLIWAAPLALIQFFVVMTSLPLSSVARFSPFFMPWLWRYGRLSCAGWLFGIEECVISVPGVLGMLVLSVAFVWFSIWAWDRYSEA